MKKNNQILLVNALGAFFFIVNILLLQLPVHAVILAKANVNHSDLIQNKIVADYGNLPLYFETNKGQSNKQAKFLSHGKGYILSLTNDSAVFSLNKSNIVSIKLLNANENTKVTGIDKLPLMVNYFIGSDSHKWLREIKTYGKVKYADIYPGIDLVYYGNQKKLEYDFIVSPGATPNNIKLSYSGITDLNIDKKGQLILHTSEGNITQLAPFIYQIVNGIKQKIDGKYVLYEDGKTIGFNVLSYDVTKPLIIDPVLVYSTFLGGVNNDFGWAIDVDSEGNAYVTGSTLSVSDFPTTAGVVQPKFGGGAAGSNIFVTKFNSQGVPVYSTYIGGSGLTFGLDIKVDDSGNAYVAGTAYSQTSFPTTTGAYQTMFGGGAADVVVVKLNPSGSSLVFSTFLGGSSFDGGTDQSANGSSNDDGSSIFDSFWHMGIDLDGDGNIYVTGTTLSPDFPVIAGVLQSTKAGAGPSDAFVTKLNPAGSGLIYSTYLGGASADLGNDIAVDDSGNAYITGSTGSLDFPTTPNAFLSTINSPGNAFVTKLNPNGSALIYSTYLGGSDSDESFSIDIDSKGSAYVTGYSAVAVNPPLFPITDGAFQTKYSGGAFDAYVTKINPDGASLAYSTFLGGTQLEHGNAISVDASGNAYVIGHTNSNDFPTSDPIQTETMDSNFDVFVTKVNPTGSALTYSTYLGGSQFEDGLGIAVDSTGAAYLTGYTETPINPPFFPTTNGAFQDKVKGNADAFIAKISGTGSMSSSSGGLSIPDLTGSWVNLTQSCRNFGMSVSCRVKGRLKIENIGAKASSTSFVKFFVSNDSTFDSSDTFLKQVATGKIKAHGSKFKTIVFNLPNSTDATGKFILAVLDSENVVNESDENNNTVVFGPLQ